MGHLNESSLCFDTESSTGTVECVNEKEEKSCVNITDFRRKKAEELLKIATQYGIEDAGSMTKQDLIFNIFRKVLESEDVTVLTEGVVEVLSDSFAFIRSPESNYTASSDDVYVSPGQVKKFRLKTGDTVIAELRSPKREEKYFAVVRIVKINGEDFNYDFRYVQFDSLVPLYPDQQLKLESENAVPHKEEDISCRVIDLIAPLGKGQRALIVSPPKTGKTILLKKVAHAISRNNPETHLIVLLIDERPEEVTDMQRAVKGEVISSTFDEPAHRHVQLAELVIAKARRMVEKGKDVVILLDSITRLARAYNTVIPSSGKVLSGGVDSNALQRPKRFFGAARNVENGGSLTIIATALIDTGSRMDEVIFEEFKGTGNCEIVLDRKIADKRIFPAIDLLKSGTRREDLLIEENILKKIWLLRKVFASMGMVESMEQLHAKMIATKNNNDFFDNMQSDN